MSCRREPAGFVFAILIAVVLTGCRRETAPAVERLAVLPLDNLGSEASFSPAGSWAGGAAAAALAYDLTGTRNVYAQALVSAAQSPAMQASRALEGYFFERNGRMEIHATLEDLRTSRTAQSRLFTGPSAQGLLPLVNQLARALSADARPFSTTNPEAFRLWGEALGAGDKGKLIADLTAATEADPRFTAASIDLAQALAASGDRDKARQVITAAESGRPGPIDQAQLEYMAASLAGDANARLQALSALARRNPANAGLFVDLGQQQLARRNFPATANDYREAARLNPSDGDIWNQLGYAFAYGQNLTEARRALEQYRRLDPEGENPLDSLGEVSYFLGDFEGAGKYFLEAAEKNPAEFMKAAEARLMTGDVAGADALFRKRFGQGRATAGADYQTAQWEYLSGRPKTAIERMEKLAQEPRGDLQALALSQLSIWRLDSGDPAAAAELANRAGTIAQGPQAREISATCRAITSGSTGSGSRTTDALALLLAGKLRDALPLLEAAYRESSPSGDGQVRTLLAWTYAKTGAVDKAGPLVAIYPLPLSSGDPLVASLILRMYWFARGSMLQDEGKLEEAGKSFHLYEVFRGRDQVSAAK